MHSLLEKLRLYHHDAGEALKKVDDANRDPKLAGTQELRDMVLVLVQRMQSADEQKHHANEELIRGVLRSTDAPMHRLVEQIADDHAAFDRLVANLKNCCCDECKDAPELHNCIQHYLDNYYQHMEAEETIFFPLADKWLDDERWQLVRRQWRH